MVTKLGFTHVEELVGAFSTSLTPTTAPTGCGCEKACGLMRCPFLRWKPAWIHQSGTSFWCRVTSVLFEDEEGELGYITLEDITERKELEIKHKRLFEAQENLLYLVAHDLKSPVNNLTMLVDLLRNSEDQENPALLDLVEEGCATISILLQDILYLGQLQSTRLEKHSTDLGAFLDERLKVFQVAAETKGITLDLPRTPVLAAIHADKFGSILSSFCSAMPSSSRPKAARLCACSSRIGGKAAGAGHRPRHSCRLVTAHLRQV